MPPPMIAREFYTDLEMAEKFKKVKKKVRKIRKKPKTLRAADLLPLDESDEHLGRRGWVPSVLHPSLLFLFLYFLLLNASSHLTVSDELICLLSAKVKSRGNLERTGLYPRSLPDI